MTVLEVLVFWVTLILWSLFLLSITGNVIAGLEFSSEDVSVVPFTNAYIFDSNSVNDSNNMLLIDDSNYALFKFTKNGICPLGILSQNSYCSAEGHKFRSWAIISLNDSLDESSEVLFKTANLKDDCRKRLGECSRQNYIKVFLSSDVVITSSTEWQWVKKVKVNANTYGLGEFNAPNARHILLVRGPGGGRRPDPRIYWVGLNGSETTVPAVCNNGVIESGEVCDGTNFGDLSCVTEGFTGGNLACINSCATIDTSGCNNNSGAEGFTSFADFFAGSGSSIDTTSSSDYLTIGGLEPILGMKISLGIFDSTGGLVGYANNPFKDFVGFTGSMLGSYDGVGLSLQGWSDTDGDGVMGGLTDGILTIDEGDDFWFPWEISYEGGPLGNFTGLSADLGTGSIGQIDLPAPAPIPQPSSGIFLALGLTYIGARQIMKKRR